MPAAALLSKSLWLPAPTPSLSENTTFKVCRLLFMLYCRCATVSVALREERRLRLFVDCGHGADEDVRV